MSQAHGPFHRGTPIQVTEDTSWSCSCSDSQVRKASLRVQAEGSGWKFLDGELASPSCTQGPVRLSLPPQLAIPRSSFPNPLLLASNLTEDVKDILCLKKSLFST